MLEARTLIARLEAGSLIAGIRDHSHASSDNFQRHYATVIDRFLEFAQLLPASESHHHAQPGGMALHTLETVLHALSGGKGMMLPPGAPTEAQQRAQHRWTYAVFLAALLHDAGKAAHDLRITYDSAAHVNAVWNPLVGSLHRARGSELPGRLCPRRHAQLRRAPALPTGLVAEVRAGTGVGLAGRRRNAAAGAGRISVWRTRATARWRNWWGPATANRSGAICLTGPRQRFASARTAPLIERLMEALRRMLADGAWLPLNRDGAAGWVADDAVWFVSKRLADEVRRFLLAQGDHAVPGEDKNDRLFDVWQEYGAAGTQSMHRRCHLARPGRRRGLRPRTHAAALSVIAPMARCSALSLRHAGTHCGSAGDGCRDRDRLSKGRSGRRIRTSAIANDDTKVQSVAARQPVLPLLCLTRPTMRRPSSLARPSRPRRGSRCRPPSVRYRPCTKAQRKQPSALALEFMAWVQRGVADGSLSYNESGALVHFVAEGLFLVSPGLFRAYADAHPAAPNAEPGSAKDWPGKAVQKAVCGCGLESQGSPQQERADLSGGEPRG